MNRMWKRIRSLITNTIVSVSVGIGVAAFALATESRVEAGGAPRGEPTTLYVDDDAPSGGDGLTWATAFDDLQAALEATSEPGSEIRMAQGMYRPTHRADPADARTATFQLISGVTLRGGYAGLGASDPDEWDPATLITTLSGDLNGDDGPEFANNGENTYHVVLCLDALAVTTFEGCMVTAGNANVVDSKTFAHRGGGLLTMNSNLIIRACRFHANAARYGGGAYWSGAATRVEQCRFTANFVANSGGALWIVDVPEILISSSTFIDNTANSGGGAIFNYVDSPDGPPQIIEHCEFRENSAVVAGAIHTQGSVTLRHCQFEHNQANGGGGVIIVAHAGSSVSNCFFVGNLGGLDGGGMVIAAIEPLPIDNCVFVDNHANKGGAMVIGVGSAVVNITNCTIVGNSNTGVLLTDSVDGVSITNSILWGNIPAQVAVDDGSPPTLLPPSVSVSFSSIQDGWDGEGNVNADPMFIQPGCYNLRLAHESPCLNTGSNAGIPPGVTTDIDGQPRIQDGIVDMGAYEGAFDMLDPAACDEDVDVQETVLLAPTGFGYQPVAHSLVQFTNMTGEENGFASLTQIEDDVHKSAGGFSELGDILRLETGIPHGQQYSRMFLSFDAAMLNGLDPLSLDLTRFDGDSDDWTLAAAGNTVNSPGHDNPVGDRIVMIGTDTNYGLTPDMGDHGVFWNPDLQRGFVWANVDFSADFAVGSPLTCVADCAAPHDGQVDVTDLLAVLAQWGSAPPNTPADINGDGAVDVDDLVAIILAWGPCS